MMMACDLPTPRQKKSPRQTRTRTLIVWLLEIPRKFDAIRHAL